MVRAWLAQCPLGCKKSWKYYDSENLAREKVKWHMMHSEKHYLDEKDADDCVALYDDCVWSEEVDDEAANEEGKLDEAEEGTSNKRSRNDDGTTPAKGRGKGHVWVNRKQENQIVQRTADAVLEQVVGDTQWQKQSVYNFARVMGKCEMVIQTASKVASRAARAFEVLSFMFVQTCS